MNQLDEMEVKVKKRLLLLEACYPAMTADAMRGGSKLDVREGMRTAASLNERNPSHIICPVAHSLLQFEK